MKRIWKREILPFSKKEESKTKLELFIEYFLSIYAYLSINKLIIGDIDRFWDMIVQDTFYLVELQKERDEEMRKQMEENENGNNRSFSEPLYEDDDEAIEERENRFRD